MNSVVHEVEKCLSSLCRGRKGATLANVNLPPIRDNGHVNGAGKLRTPLDIQTTFCKTGGRQKPRGKVTETWGPYDARQACCEVKQIAIGSHFYPQSPRERGRGL